MALYKCLLYVVASRDINQFYVDVALDLKKSFRFSQDLSTKFRTDDLQSLMKFIRQLFTFP